MNENTPRPNQFEMSRPKVPKPHDADGAEINEGDMLQMAENSTLRTGPLISLPKGTTLGRARYFFNRDHIEVDRVYIGGGNEIDLVIPTRLIRKTPVREEADEEPTPGGWV